MRPEDGLSIEARVANYSHAMNQQRADSLSNFLETDTNSIFSYIDTVDISELSELENAYPELFQRLIEVLSFRMSMKIFSIMKQGHVTQIQESVLATLHSPRGASRNEFFGILDEISKSTDPGIVNVFNADALSELRAKALWFSKVTGDSLDATLREVIADVLGIAYYSREMKLPTELRFLRVKMEDRKQHWDFQLEHMHEVTSINAQNWCDQLAETAIAGGTDSRFATRQAQSFMKMINSPEGHEQADVAIQDELSRLPQHIPKVSNAIRGDLPAPLSI